MGLDQFAYAMKGDDKLDIMTWRKHPNLQGYMDELWESKDRPLRACFGFLTLHKSTLLASAILKGKAK